MKILKHVLTGKGNSPTTLEAGINELMEDCVLPVSLKIRKNIFPLVFSSNVQWA